MTSNFIKIQSVQLYRVHPVYLNFTFVQAIKHHPLSSFAILISFFLVFQQCKNPPSTNTQLLNIYSEVQNSTQENDDSYENEMTNNKEYEVSFQVRSLLVLFYC